MGTAIFKGDVASGIGALGRLGGVLYSAYKKDIKKPWFDMANLMLSYAHEPIYKIRTHLFIPKRTEGQIKNRAKNALELNNTSSISHAEASLQDY